MDPAAPLALPRPSATPTIAELLERERALAAHFATIRACARRSLVERTCDSCGGSGRVEGYAGAQHDCSSCDGTGSLAVQRLKRLRKRAANRRAS